MKQTLLIILGLILGFSLVTTSSCKDKIDDNQPVEKIYDGDLTYIDYQGLQEFYQDGYTVINGDLKIDNFDSLKDLSLLSNLKRVHGDFRISVNSELESLEGLTQPDTISGSFTILYCNKLANLKGVENLKYIGYDFRVMQNESMVDLDGISSLNYVGMTLKVSSNHNMLSLAGLENLVTIDGVLEIGEFDGAGNDNLASIEALSSLKVIGLRLDIYRCIKLNSLAGLDGLEHSGEIRIQRNAMLNDFCPLSHLINLDGLTGLFTTQLNAYNPTIEDMKAGNCSQ